MRTSTLKRGLFLFILFQLSPLIHCYDSAHAASSTFDEFFVSSKALDLGNHELPPRNQFLYGGEHHDVKILTDVRHRSIANSIRECFQYLGVFATIVQDIDERDAFGNVMYIFLHALGLNVPAGLKYVVYQTEQKERSPWFDGKYRKIFAEDSLYVFDFSILNFRIISDLQNKTAYLPIPLSLSTGKISAYEFDILFYGSLCPRRSRILDELQRKHNLQIKVVSGVYGDRMFQIIKKARVVLNLHCFEEALLETARINEVLQYDKIVVSEEPVAEDRYSRALYKDVVVFTKNLDENNEDFAKHVEELATTLRFYSNPRNHRTYIGERKPVLASLKAYCLSRFKKALMSLQAFSPTAFHKRLYPDTIYYLSLDESWQTRRDIFLKQAHLPANVRRIPGIKASPGWTGCGMSYKFAMNSAKISGLDYVTICEDDALFPPTFERDYRIILEYLSTLEKWDIFVGLIADFDENTKIHNVETYKGLEFVTIDKFTSTVFNIYNASSFDHFLSWDEHNLDSLTNTIDRYLQNKNLTIVTTNPYFLKHMVLESTLWGNDTAYPEWFARSANVFSKKIEYYKSMQKTMNN